MANIWHRWQQFAAQLLQIPQKYQVRSLSMPALDFVSVELFSATDCMLLESMKLEKLTNKL